ncbi:MAG: transcription factor S [Nanoarchaeota archaeon]|nr:transcription factor S [Nanoarchaeota archaeon]MBU1644658.1 transcription factor S [Nanoarchaeota archaeon]MBU1976971.1 transcription factor S [Nanoarchaeota archaeon]
MLMFCPKCGSILRPKEKAGKKILFCNCGFSKVPEDETVEIREKGTESKKIEVIEQLETHPKIKISCEKCGNNVAYYWTQQTRGADEPETRFFKCTKCNYTWREYA